jgi:TldD protein
MDRRDFLKTTAATGSALAVGAAVTGCRSAPAGVDAFELSLAQLALDVATTSGAVYADVRISQHHFERVSTREQQITGVSSSESYGVGVRALVGGSWGFSATSTMTREAVTLAATQAAEMAKANDRLRPETTELAPVDVVPDGSWITPHTTDPFDVSIEEKAALLFETNDAALAVNGVAFVSSSLLAGRDRVLLATSDGSIVHQTFLRVAPSVRITAISRDRSDFQTRSTDDWGTAGGGWEHLTGLDLPGRASGWGEEAVQKLTAPSVEAGNWDLVIAPSNLWLTVHEAIGHPTELDRALGYEANYAGTTFLSPPDQVLNRFQFGPEFMQVNGNRTERGGCATCGFDDEAVPAHKWPIVRDGLFVDYQTTREQAAWISDQTGVHFSHGCAFGQNWASIAFQRMPNVSIEPGIEDRSTEDLIADVERGIFIDGSGSYSIDQQRYNFQFGGQVFWEIKNGKKDRMIRDVAYVGRTPDFWNAMSAIGGAQTYELIGTFGDGKGQPGQSNAVSHGCPTAVFRDQTVVNTA